MNEVVFSGLTVCIFALVSLLLCVFIGEKLKVNMGIIALIFASILGVFVFKMRSSAIYTFWPISITLQVIVVTFFYGFANKTGTVKYMADWAIYASRLSPALLPLVFYVLDFFLMAIGLHPAAVMILLLPVFIQISYDSKRSEMLFLIGHCLASDAGGLSPIGMTGIIGRGLIEMFGFEGQGNAIIGRVWITLIIVCTLLFLVAYFVFGGYKMKVEGEVKKPAPATPLIKKNLILIAICVLAFLIPTLLALVFPKVPFFATLGQKIDVLLVYSVGIVLALLLKLGDQREILKECVPWHSVLLVGGCATLIAVCSSMGMGDYLSGLITNISNVTLIAPVLALLAGLVSLVSDSTGVVYPLFFPVVAGVVAATGYQPSKLFACIMLGALLAGIAPTSSGGSMELSFIAPERRDKVFLYQWATAFIMIFVFALLSLTPLVG